MTLPLTFPSPFPHYMQKDKEKNLCNWIDGNPFCRFENGMSEMGKQGRKDMDR